MVTTEQRQAAIEDLRGAAAVAKIDIPEFVLPEDHDAVVRRFRLHYLDWGNPEQPPFLFLHGGGLTAHSWDLVCLALRQDYHCIALDLRGHGDSEWSPGGDYGVASLAADVEGFVEQLGWERFVLMGMSMGGLTSIKFCERNVERLRGLVIVDVGPEVERPGAHRIREFTSRDEALGSVEEFVERAMEFNPRRDPRLLRRSLLHNLRQLPDGQWTWKTDRRHRGDPELFDKMVESHRALWDVVPGITCPTLVVRGSESDVFTDEQADRLTSTLPKGRRVTVPNAGHTVQGDNPAGLVEALRPFLAELPAR